MGVVFRNKVANLNSNGRIANEHNDGVSENPSSDGETKDQNEQTEKPNKDQKLNFISGLDSPDDKYVTIVGPFVFYSMGQHVVDNCSKIMFPLMFILANAIYFSFHRLHPDTVN